ncbi:membrane anchoring protein efr3a [Cichlidogyrus casuarinus]|uniref:Membrane anchoring protein efr3a n=1 Tax=Cichlidogyrus casuarinus TaxID=1844966 RepID=A0ABD2Q6S1_9PLAT
MSTKVTTPAGLHCSTLQAVAAERQFQDAIITTIAEFAKNLSESQQIEILKFVLNFDSEVILRKGSNRRSQPFVLVLMKTMLQVAEQYQCSTISNALHPEFLKNLLRGVAVDKDPAIRIYVQKLLHTLMDRNHNSAKLMKVRIYTQEESLSDELQCQSPDMQDILFMKQTGVLLTENLFWQLLESSNKVDNLEHVCCTISLIALEMSADEVLLELFRLLLAVQEKVVPGGSKESASLPQTHRCAVHAIVASQMTLLVKLLKDRAPAALCEHIYGVIERRGQDAPHLLPKVAFNRNNTQGSYPADFKITDELLFHQGKISNILEDNHFDVSGLDIFSA